MKNIGVMLLIRTEMIYLIFLCPLLSLVQTSDYSVVIDEKSPIEQTILHLPQPYELINNFQSNFNLTNNNRDLVLTKLIDRDYWCSQNICSCEDCSFILELFANVNQTPTFSSINVTIKDINDHTCQFFDLQSNISLSEAIQVEHRFPIARAIDYDSGLNAKLSFRLLNNEDYFQLDIIPLSYNEYAIYGIVKRPLDRETNERFELVIEARDHGFPQARSNRTKVTIEILDENDNAPKFNQTEYSIQSLPENTPIGSELLTIFASDPDQGLNGLVHYSIVNPPNNSSFPFAINAKTGVITLRSSLDYETTRAYRFLIRASDSGVAQTLFTDTWLSISIADVNDCPPEILFVANRRFQYDNQTLFIYENTEIKNLTLGYIRLFDRDSLPTKLLISLISSEQPSKQDYEIVPSNQVNSYILIAKQGIFDREMQEQIHLRFVATDSLLTSIFDLTIHLIDVNDNPSEFPSNPLVFFVEELANYQMVDHPIEDYQFTVGYLNAVDRDQGENALSTYELEAHPVVKVDAKTGRLYLIQPIDREQIPKIVLQVKAINVAAPKWVTDVQIQIVVLDVNDNTPRCSSPFHRLTIAENFSINQPVIKINANDPDQGLNGTISYHLRTNSSWPFEINAKTGAIYSKQPFDYESDFKQFTLTIDLEDNGLTIKNTNRNACQVQILLEDVNDNRPELLDNNQTKLFFDIRQPYQNQRIQLNITDKDSGMNGKVMYHLQSIDANIPLTSNQSVFTLNQNGTLQLTSEIKQIALFTLRILLEDGGHPSQQTLLQIAVAFGDSLQARFLSFEQVQRFFDEKRSRTNDFAFIFGVTILSVTFLFFISILVICLIIRQHRRRHKATMISRNKLLCSSSQQLTTSNSTVTSHTTSSSLEHQQIIRPPYWNDPSFVKSHPSANTSSAESDTYKILHIPLNKQYYDQDKADDVSCDHGYHESYQTGSSSSTSSPQQFPTEVVSRQEQTFSQLPFFVTKCKSLGEGFLVEMNVDGSDEDGR